VQQKLNLAIIALAHSAAARSGIISLISFHHLPKNFNAIILKDTESHKGTANIPVLVC